MAVRGVAMASDAAAEGAQEDEAAGADPQLQELGVTAVDAEEVEQHIIQRVNFAAGMSANLLVLDAETTCTCVNPARWCAVHDVIVDCCRKPSE